MASQSRRRSLPLSYVIDTSAQPARDFFFKENIANREKCANCRKEIVNTNLKQLEVHAMTHDQKVWTKEKCWPNDFKAESGAAAAE